MVYILAISIFILNSIPTYLYPKSHTFLHVNKYYFIALLISFSIAFFAFVNKDDFAADGYEMVFVFYSLSPLTLILLHKLFDKIIMSKLNRHLYFKTKGGDDIETMNAKWYEFAIQMFLMAIPIWTMSIPNLLVYCC
jgi:hypothetical protein